MPDLEQIRQLIEQPRESLAVEIKSWLDLDNPRHLAKLIKAALALRNVNGGHIVIGFDDSLQPSADPPSDVVRAYHPDRIQAAVARYASEPFEISVDYPERDGVRYPVIGVPAGVRSVVAAKAELKDDDGRVLIAPHDVYVRSLRDNNTPSSAKVLWRDWEALGQIHFDNREADVGSFVRRHLSLASLQTLREVLLQPATTKPSKRASAFLDESRRRFQAITLERDIQFPDHGAWDVSVVIDGEVPPRKANREFLRLIDVSNPAYTGWPVWLVSDRFRTDAAQPFVHEGMWEALIVLIGEADLHDHLDFVRFDPKGRFYNRRAYEDDIGDGPGRPDPLKELDFGEAILRTAESIAVALALGKALGCEPATSTLSFAFGWERLKGRYLTSWMDPARSLSVPRRAYQDEVTSDVELPLDMPLSRLGEITKQVIDPLFEVFDGFEISQRVVTDLASRLVNRKL